MRLAVYCGSSATAAPVYYEAARQLGTLLASRGFGVVYGGGSVGMMGTVADAALAGGGEVLGVIPTKLMDLELGHPGCTEMYVVESMHARKSMMMHLADGYIALPGGYGTLEELFEAVTWAQLNYHRKPVGLLNVEGYFDHLIAFVDHAIEVGFVRPELRGLMTVHHQADALLTAMQAAEVPAIESWLR